jgi:hypothetical protein
MESYRLAKGVKADLSESKIEARSALNKALEAAETERDLTADEFEDEEIEEDDPEEDDGKKKVKDESQNDEESTPEEEDDFTPATKQSKFSKVQQPKPVQQASYIMKLFDRSVNLAKFDEETPLYPLCRAWMKNQPRAVGVKNERIAVTAAAPEPMQVVEDGDVVEIPKVRIRSKTKPLVSRPDNKLNKKDFDKKIDSEIWTKEKLFQYHKLRWGDERTRHIENSINFEKKHFAANFELLESMMKENADADE